MASVQRARVLEWAKLIAVTGAAQVVVQAIGFVSGILVIRLLPVHEYALYTLANTMLGTMTILADGGIAAGVMSEGGKVWQDRQKLGAVMATGMELRRKFAVFSLLVAVPILLFLLRRHDASWLMSVLIVLSLIPAFFSALSGSLLMIPAKLHQNVAPMQRRQVEANVGRLVITTFLTFLFPIAAAAIACSGLSQLYNNLKLREISLNLYQENAEQDSIARSRIIGVVRRQLPEAIYYCISGQLTIWIISLFGSSDSLAQVGALSRYAAALTVLQIVVATLLVPRFARMTGGNKAFLRKFVAVHCGLAALSLIIIVACSSSSSFLLYLLGAGYSGMKAELVLAVCGGCINMISATTHQILISRGLVVPPAMFIAIIICSQALFIYALRPHDVRSVLLLGLLTAASAFVIRIGYLVSELKKS